ncbi:hypothetical protein TVAG_163810 [Trichomonas vaginalis G3]|uniref:Uncharacterized protein n=1 Tax=Trichomonas vaginalis (strain ATCC PRA-98 / G3) TaxID=412133 RepID=A2DG58_TRIV3|nr:hypothetical protein TVAGG3_0953880 [Trichomonas vaginalis G3]EAY20685.1 hypothetical protein TVAG_163810 [Trichomonas vaginalis G3]KAI5487406.1 hypothetical protein TVAGG3_0953880 [Trichomonas vaginalis G3]|eukprot:XP_001581671.1 hypothetical protein [Trichomonas vaginalis G3]
MLGKAKQSPRVTPNRKTEKSAVSSSKKVTPTGKSPLKLKNLCSVTPTQRNVVAKEEKPAETPSQMESRIRCELRLEMLVRMREMQDYYESKIADLTEAMDNDSYTISALYGNDNSDSESSENKVNPEILEITKKIEEAVAKRDQLLKILDEKKRQNAAIAQEIQAGAAQNAKLIEQRNGLQMRVDALRKQKQDEDLRINAAKEEQQRFEFLASESANEENIQAPVVRKDSSSSSLQRGMSQKSVDKITTIKEEASQSKSSKLNPHDSSKKDKKPKSKIVKGSENSNVDQNSLNIAKKIPKENTVTNVPVNIAPQRSITDTVGEFNQKPYRMKITAQLVHKAKKNKD